MNKYQQKFYKRGYKKALHDIEHKLEFDIKLDVCVNCGEYQVINKDNDETIVWCSCYNKCSDPEYHYPDVCDGSC